MEEILGAIRTSLAGGNWLGAIVLALTLPDICGKLEGTNKSSSARYCEWFEKYLTQYKGYLSGSDCYALRCSFLHEGSDNIETQRSRDVLDRFIFMTGGPHCFYFSKSKFGDSKYDGKDVLVLNLQSFCHDIVEAVEKWLLNSVGDQTIEQNLDNMLKINEPGFAINKAIRFGQ
jgi:hypothetical protein